MPKISETNPMEEEKSDGKGLMHDFQSTRSFNKKLLTQWILHPTKDPELDVDRQNLSLDGIFMEFN